MSCNHLLKSPDGSCPRCQSITGPPENEKEPRQGLQSNTQTARPIQNSTTQVAQESQILDHALSYASMGWHVFPLNPRSKIPLQGTRGHLDASCDEAQIRAWWGHNPEYNVGIALDPSGLVALDIDVGTLKRSNGTTRQKVGQESFRQLIESFPEIANPTLSYFSGAGDPNYPNLVFSRPAGVKGARKIRFLHHLLPEASRDNDLDLLGDGFIVAAPSIHPNGNPYVWDQYVQPVPLPEPLSRAFTARAPVITAEQAADGVIGEGGRDNALFRLAAALREINLSEQAIVLALHQENQMRCEPPLPDHDISRIANSAFNKVVPDKDVMANAGIATALGLTPSFVMGADGWMPPIPLAQELRVVPKLSVDLLPTNMRDWCSDCTERAGVPLEYMAIPAMIALCTMVGGRTGIRPKAYDDWEVFPNTFGIAIGDSGEIKSSLAKKGIAGLSAVEKARKSEFAKGEAERNTEERLLIEREKTLSRELKDQSGASTIGGGVRSDLKARLLQLEKDKLSFAAQKLPLYIVNDATAPALHTACIEHPQGLLYFCDEASTLFEQMGQETYGGLRGMLLSGWNGDSGHKSLRVGRGTNDAESVILSFVGTIQPAPLISLMRKELGTGDGLVQRLQLMTWPDTSDCLAGVDRAPDTAAKERFLSLWARLDEIPTPLDKAPCLQFDSQAQEVMTAWRTAHEVRLKSGELDHLAGIKSHLSKYRSLVPTLALVDHLASGGSHLAGTPIGLPSLERALQWAEYLEKHAWKIYEAAEGQTFDQAAWLLKQLGNAHYRRNVCDRDGIVLAKIYKNKNSDLWNSASTTEALDTLAEHNWVRRVESAKNKVRYELCPSLTGDVATVQQAPAGTGEPQNTNETTGWDPAKPLPFAIG